MKKALIRHPIWAINFLSLFPWNRTDSSDEDYWTARCDVMRYGSKFILEWLDQTRVRGDPGAEALCRVLWKIWGRTADWGRVGWSEGEMIIRVYRRLRGLVC